MDVSLTDDDESGTPFGIDAAAAGSYPEGCKGQPRQPRSCLMLRNQRTPARALLALAATLLVGGETLAAGPETDGVRINGTVNQEISVDGSANIAAGTRSRARTEVGSIGDGVTVDGRLNVIVQTGPIATVAAGAGQEAKTVVGAVNEDVAGQTDVVISTGQIINQSVPGSGRPACVVIGALGEVPGC
jgi:hypothetical protein